MLCAIKQKVRLPIVGRLLTAGKLFDVDNNLF